MERFKGPLFEELDWDSYDTRRQQIEFLLAAFSEEHAAKKKHFKAYYTGQINQSVFSSWPRVFTESPKSHADNDLFYNLMRAVFLQVKKVHLLAYSLRMTAHFMSVEATRTTLGNNSPEGAHEDGADYIISALVINRKNLKGSASQIIEKHLPDGSKEMIFEYTLQLGEFFFQSDSRDETFYGTDLWHHVTLFYIEKPEAGDGWRDIIDFDFDVVDFGQFLRFLLSSQSLRKFTKIKIDTFNFFPSLRGRARE